MTRNGCWICAFGLLGLALPAMAADPLQAQQQESAKAPQAGAARDTAARRDDATRSAANDPRRDLFARHTVSDGNGNSLPYRLMSPADYQADGDRTYPVVLFLHGAGERGSDNEAQLKHGALEFATAERREKFPCFVIAPQCPEEQKWVEVDWSDRSGPVRFPDAPGIPMQLAQQALTRLIESERVDPTRIYITGLSMGGYGTWAAVAYDPDRFAAAIPICGGGDARFAERYQGVPVWAFHGAADAVVPPSRSRDMIQALTAAGVRPEPKYTEYPGVKHDSWSRTYADDQVYQWLFSQRQQR